MSKEDLIPLGQPGNEEHDRKVRSRLKGSSSDKRKFAQKVNHISQMKPEKAESEIMRLVIDPRASATQIQELIRQALERDLSNSDFINLIRVVVSKHSAIFGNKITLDASVEVGNRKMSSLMAHRHVEHKLLEEKKEEWKARFGEEQATEMYDEIVYKYKPEFENEVKSFAPIIYEWRKELEVAV